MSKEIRKLFKFLTGEHSGKFYVVREMSNRHLRLKNPSAKNTMEIKTTIEKHFGKARGNLYRGRRKIPTPWGEIHATTDVTASRTLRYPFTFKIRKGYAELLDELLAKRKQEQLKHELAATSFSPMGRTPVRGISGVHVQLTNKE